MIQNTRYIAHDIILTKLLEAEHAEAHTLVSSGRTLPDQQIIIVDPSSLQQAAPDQVGEIWIAGPSVAQGYWQQLAETETAFHAHLANEPSTSYLRSGDLGFLHEQELFVTGRLKRP